MGKTILVADDSDTICRAVEMTFQATEFSVVSARSGDDALGQIERVQPDLVLADCIMDGVDGYTVCARIKDAGHAIPVVLMASSAQPVDRQRAEMARANTSLSKPFDTKTLLNVVRQLTGTEPVAETPAHFRRRARSPKSTARRNRATPGCHRFFARGVVDLRGELRGHHHRGRARGDGYLRTAQRRN